MEVLILTFLMLTVLFISAILIVSIIKRCSAGEATRICVNFLKDITDNLTIDNQPVIYYPVYLGFDGSDISPDLLDDELKSVKELFLIFYFLYCKRSPDGNLIQYYFSFKRKPDSISDMDLESIIQGFVEEILSKLLKQNGFYIIPKALVAVNIKESTLEITIALTNLGIPMITQIKELIQHKYRPETDTLEQLNVDWND